MTYRTYWTGSVWVAEWEIKDPAGAPVDDATVSGVVSTPSGSTAAMTVTHDAGSPVYRGAYQAAQAGRHGWKMTSSAGAQGVVEGEFYVSRETTGAPPIILDPAEPVGMMRLLVTDVDEAFPILTDPQYLALLGLEGGNVKKGAAAALEAIATSETLRTKKITTQDLSIDGPAVAEDLRKRAKLLRDQVRSDITDTRDDDAYADGFGFDFVDFDPHASRWPRAGC